MNLLILLTLLVVPLDKFPTPIGVAPRPRSSWSQKYGTTAMPPGVLFHQPNSPKMPNVCPSDYVGPEPWHSYQFNGMKVHLFPASSAVSASQTRAETQHQSRQPAIITPAKTP